MNFCRKPELNLNDFKVSHKERLVTSLSLSLSLFLSLFFFSKFKQQQRKNTQHNCTLYGFLFVHLFELNFLTCSCLTCESCFQPIACWACAASRPHGCQGSQGHSSPWHQPVTQTDHWAPRAPATHPRNKKNIRHIFSSWEAYKNQVDWTFLALVMSKKYWWYNMIKVGFGSYSCFIGQVFP